MQIPIEPNLDKPVPAVALPQAGKTYEQRVKIAANTAMVLAELGMDDEISEEEDAKAKEMFARMQPVEEKNKKATPEEKELSNPSVALAINTYLRDYERQIVEDKVQVRTVVVNRLLEISKNDDDKVALKALELLGKASDLFTERSEITITHKTSDELKAAIRERINQLMQMQKIENKTPTQSRLDQLKDVQDVEAVEVKDANS